MIRILVIASFIAVCGIQWGLILAGAVAGWALLDAVERSIKRCNETPGTMDEWLRHA